MEGYPGLRQQDVSSFGLSKEDPQVMKAALDFDERANNQYDTGETWARHASR